MTMQDTTTMTLGTLINQAWEIREEIRRLEKILKENNTALDNISNAIIIRLDNEDVPSSRSGKAHARINETKHYAISDPDQFYTWMEENGTTYLLQKRIASKAYEEYTNMTGDEPPGVTSYLKRKLILSS